MIIDDPAERRAAAVEEFGVVLGRPLDGGYRSSVFEARTAGGEPVVLKIPATRAEADAEIAALARWRDSGAAVRVLAADERHGALLLERLRPGTALPPLDADAILPIGQLLARLHACGPGDRLFDRLEDGYAAAEEQARRDLAYERRQRNESSRGEAGLALLGAAAATVEDLARSTRRPVLLHGDFTNKNLLASGQTFVAIDPIPRIGDPCADAGHLAAAQPADRILDVAAALATAADLDQERVLRWTAVLLVIQDCQAWRDDQDGLDRLLARQGLRSLLRPRPKTTTARQVSP
ncbi:aminoglycoside phosphotransferase family protein [Microlunatus parietis]|uniref:Streptomycin 6-kinase n=1 Tax=Microlunatus parietis TaxID=682979 RepID=A0A7Y9LBH5_9ACTN|nr:aminoglycoside phosphotransferase family protein [Microlunatus parietis]NYE70858.1 streptomycin 6-kinase [Microlunatus parietis]